MPRGRRVDEPFAKVPQSLLRQMAKECLPLNARNLYVLLRSYANTEGRCFPSNKVLALDLDCSERTIQRLFSILMKAGWVRRKHDEGSGPYARWTTWLLTPPAQPKRRPGETRLSPLKERQGRQLLSPPGETEPGVQRRQRLSPLIGTDQGNTPDVTDQPVQELAARLRAAINWTDAEREAGMADDPRVHGEAVPDDDDGFKGRKKEPKRKDLIPTEGTAAWAEYQFRRLIEEHLHTNRFNQVFFRRICKTLRDKDQMTNEQIVFMIRGWVIREAPALRPKLKRGNLDPATALQQAINSGLVERYCNEASTAQDPERLAVAATRDRMSHLLED